jgi:PAS domain S-box-containing protein
MLNDAFSYNQPQYNETAGSDLKMIKATLSVALHKTKEPAFGVDREGLICDWNRGASTLFGYSRSEAMRRPCAELLRCGGGGHNRCDLFCCAREGRLVSNRDREMSAKSGSAVYVQISNLVCRDRSEHGFVVLHICRDISREKRTEALLQHVLGLATQLERLNGVRPERTPSLTEREIAILKLLSDGSNVSEVAAGFQTTTGTVRSQLSRACRKLGARNRLEAVLAAAKLGYI